MTEDNEAGIATGWNEGRLSAAGREQADSWERGASMAATTRSSRPISVEQPRPSRSRSPAGKTVFLDARLRECNYGRQNGTPADQLDRSGHLDVPYPDGESWRVAITGVASCIADLRRDRDGSRLLLIGHTSTRWAFEHLANGTRVEELIDAPFEWQPGWDYVIE